MNKFLLFWLLLFLCISLYPGIVNQDKPLNGRWDFKLKKNWEINQVGDEVFARLSGLMVSDDGLVYARDSKMNKTYIFDARGKYIKFFAVKGEGPGEVRTHMEAYLVKDTFIIADFDKLHFFKKDGSFIKSVNNMFFRRRPVFFINKNEFIASPVNVFQGSGKKGAITRVNLSTGKETVISDFQVFKGGSMGSRGGPRRLIIIVGLSPLMTVGRGKDRLYYGLSDSYKIEAADLDGKALFSFSLERKNKKISGAEKKQLFSGIRNLADHERKQLMDNFPDEPTHFYHIEEIGGFIYVFVPDPLRRFPGHQNPKQIDIFSAQGKYLYKAYIKLDKGFKPTSIVIKNNYLYAFQEDENGETRIARYHASLPGA